MFIPILMAGGNIAVRTLRGMNLHAISIYFSLSQTIVYGFIMFAFKMGLPFMDRFTTLDYIILIASAIMSLSNLMLK